MRGLQGKVAIVTGAGRGIGRGIAIRLAAEGMHVVVASRTKATLDKVVDEIRAGGGSAIGIACDVGSAEAIDAMVAETVATFGRLDLLVNNAQSMGTPAAPSISPVDHHLEDYPEDDWNHSLLTGPTATLRAMKAAFPHMKKLGRGRVINFGSQNGKYGAPFNVAYNSSKEAIRAITRTAAREWGRLGITVNCINPVIMTEGSRDYCSHHTDPDVVINLIPVGRWGTPEDAGGLCAFLASDDADFLTGITFDLDGGMNAHA